MNKKDAAIGLLFARDSILLLKRGNNAPSWGGYWSPPGGEKDEHESIMHCLRRELWEETRLKLEQAYITNIFQSKQYSSWFFEINVKTPINITLSDEHDEWMFMRLEDYHKYKITPYTRELIVKKLLDGK